jgi:putative nucleotidyltransferase with HDIG domain
MIFPFSFFRQNVNNDVWYYSPQFLGGKTMVERKEIEETFSEELQWIADTTLREKIVNVWKAAADQGGWKTLDPVPFTLLFKNSGTLTDHTKRMTHLVKAVMDQRTESLKKDYLIAGALLHDVGKLLEYEVVNGEVIKSSYGNKFRHPVSGSKLAWIQGLPDEIVHIIYAHSHEGDNLERSPESVIVHHCDFIDFHIRKSLVK